MRLRLAAWMALAALVAGAAFAQTPSGPAAVGMGGGPNGAVTAHFAGQAFAVQAVTGAPYSGEESTEHVQTLADGTHITRNMPGQKIFRDSQGRTRTERPLITAGPQAADSPVIVQINDPVAGYQYTLDPQNRVAHRVALPAGQRQAAAASSKWFQGPAAASGAQGSATSVREMAPAAIAAAPMMGVARAGDFGGAVAAGQPGSEMRPESHSEQLGTQTIEGVMCEGRRITTTFPVGSQGNDRPIVVTTETWTSPELKTRILSITSDPRSGDTTFTLRNLSTSEPDPSLFQPPADYQVVDETGQFTITLSR